MRSIYFDMDGTLADFYNVKDWLRDLENENTKPYKQAKSLVPKKDFQLMIRKLQKKGFRICIVSWLSKTGSELFHKKIIREKLLWLKNNYPTIQWNEIKIVKYGTPKSTVVKENGILFDDEKRNREEWGLEKSYNVENIMEVLGKF